MSVEILLNEFDLNQIDMCGFVDYGKYRVSKKTKQ